MANNIYVYRKGRGMGRFISVGGTHFEADRPKELNEEQIAKIKDLPYIVKFNQDDDEAYPPHIADEEKPKPKKKSSTKKAKKKSKKKR